MEIKEAQYVISSPSWDKCPPADRPEVAFIGRSNVGKSSLLNMLCNNSKLAKTSGTPGKTQLINHFAIRGEGRGRSTVSMYFVDLPGYGFASVSQRDRRRWEQMIDGYLRKRETLVTLFVLIDSRHKPQMVDLGFIQKLGNWEIPFTIVFTKVDKNTQQTTEHNVNLFLDILRQSWELPPVFFTSSAHTGEGRKAILDHIYSQVQK